MRSKYHLEQFTPKVSLGSLGSMGSGIRLGDLAGAFSAGSAGVASAVKDGAAQISDSITKLSQGWSNSEKMVFRAFFKVHASPPTDIAMRHYMARLAESGGKMDEAGLVAVMKEDLPTEEDMEEEFGGEEDAAQPEVPEEVIKLVVKALRIQRVHPTKAGLSHIRWTLSILKLGKYNEHVGHILRRVRTHT